MHKGAEIDFCGEPALMQPGNPAFAGANPNAAGKSPILRVNCVPPAPIKNHLRCHKWLIVNSRGDWIRTSDPLLPKLGIRLHALAYTAMTLHIWLEIYL